ncbi:MAG TPA: transposase [Candidatus Paceibacterota bacterium]|nr:transposase [Candidatus Paceibacterota bacterium]
MRKEPFGVGSYVHVMKRGGRGVDIVRDDNDRWRFLKLLRYLNDENAPRNWERSINQEHIIAGFTRPVDWPEAKPYVSILAFCLLDNHFHLLLQEKVEGGVAKFMQRLCTSMSANFNARHEERGTLFQGSYRARTITTDTHLQYLSAYIQVKNVFELYPWGIERAAQKFTDAYQWAQSYPFASLNDYTQKRREIIDHALVADILPEHDFFVDFAKDVIHGRYKDALEESGLDIDQLE